MFNKLITLASLAIVLSLGLAMSVNAATNTRVDERDAARSERIDQFNVLGQFAPEVRASDADMAGNQVFDPNVPVQPRTSSRRPVGSALSATAGIGLGESIDQTYEDWQWSRKHGRYIAHSWNGETGGAAVVDVHFVYQDGKDTVGDHSLAEISQKQYSGYNVYDASVTSNNWPRGQDAGCDLQSTDTLGTGNETNLDVSHAGRAVIAARSRFFYTLGDDTRVNQNMIFFQGTRHNCTYDPRSSLNTSFIDSLVYRANAMELAEDGSNYGWNPQIVMSWDGANDIAHLILGEDSYQDSPGGNDYAADQRYKAFHYYRKVGSSSFVGSWTSGIVLDSNWYHGWSLTVGPYPHHDELAVSYISESYYGALLDNNDDQDVWIRESHNGGLAWETSRSITNYTNAISGDPAHFTCWLESQALFDQNGDLHVIWTAKPTSDDPYFDGFNWQDFDENLYHWDNPSGDIVKIANGNFMNDDMLTGSMNQVHCGFGGVNTGYLGFISISQCDDKLFTTWNQIHERANRFPWRDAETQPAPAILDDCSYDAPRLSAANFDILMSVAKVATPSLWDAPRNITDTYTPLCGLPEDPEATGGVCGSEYKPSVERYNLDETGMSLTWPAASLRDMSPGADYAGTNYLNLIYLDDQYPGQAWRPELRGNENFTLNSMKWLRLACVEPVEASQIDISAVGLSWPDWVELGQSSIVTVTVINDGNVMLNVHEIGYVDGGGGWLSASASPTPGAPFQVTAGVNNTATFDLTIDATGITETTWLDGELWLKSDAANFDSLGVSIHVLAATAVELVEWDTVTTHVNMFDIYFLPEGECVALAVSNFGDMGYGAGSQGGINLDYVESETECGDRGRDGFYLINASAFTILADDASGTNSKLTQVTNDNNQVDETGFDPIGDKGSIGGGLAAGGEYDSVYTGRFVNRDTTVAFERIVYGPRSSDPENETINFMIAYTKVYSGDGGSHSHVTIGNVTDWDIPSEDVPQNTTALSNAGFVYVQGTDTTGILSCQSHTNRFGTEAFGGSYTSTEFEADDCANDDAGYYGASALDQVLMVDTTHYRDGAVLSPNQPNPLVWWDETSIPGLNADGSVQDQAVWLTYKHDITLGANDTLHFWTVLTTVRNGSLADLEAQVAYAKKWYMEVVRGCETGCCEGRVGDVNGSGDDEPTIGDISVMIDAKFITGVCENGFGVIVACIAEGDVNQSGGPDPVCDDITIGDISYLIDYLFITGPSLGLNPCL